MKRMIAIVLSILAFSVILFAQAADPALDKALLAAPAGAARNAATVIKWKSDFTYDTLRKGTNRLVCYERPLAPGTAQPFRAPANFGLNPSRAGLRPCRFT